MPDEVVNYRELLSQPTDSVERPRALPTGHYFGSILGTEFDRSKQKQTAFCRVHLKVDGPAEDVDANSVAGIDFSRREQRKDYYITPKSMWRLSDMLDAVLGKAPGKTFDERIPDLRGQRVMIGVIPQLKEDGSDTGFNDVTTLVAAP